jgi:hypothetical protein
VEIYTSMTMSVEFYRAVSVELHQWQWVWRLHIMTSECGITHQWQCECGDYTSMTVSVEIVTSIGSDCGDYTSMTVSVEITHQWQWVWRFTSAVTVVGILHQWRVSVGITSMTVKCRDYASMTMIVVI